MEKTKRLGVVILLLLMVACSDSQNKDLIDDVKALESKKQIQNFTLIETDQDKKEWVMNAESARLLESVAGDQLEIKEFEIEFFEDNIVSAVLSASLGIYDRTSEELETFGEVIIETKQKKIITSDVLWDPLKQMFITDKKVRIDAESGVLTGLGMEASRDLEVINIKNQIQGEYLE